MGVCFGGGFMTTDLGNHAMPPEARQVLKDLGVAIPDQTSAQLACYLDLLLAANKHFNLTAVRDRDQAWRRLIVDSLTLLAEQDDLPQGASVIDVGSGGGLPGLPLAVARGDLRVTLLEATGKKARFLDRCVGDLSLASVRVVHGRAETIGQDPSHRQVYDVAVCRAVGPMNRVLEYLLPLVRVGGHALVMKGPKVEQELAEVGDALDLLGAGDLQVYDAYPEGCGYDMVIVRVAKDRPTPKLYPRQPGVPKQSPL